LAYGDLRPGVMFGFDRGAGIAPMLDGDIECLSGDFTRFSVCCVDGADIGAFGRAFGLVFVVA
jgi:hypothetical protein